MSPKKTKGLVEHVVSGSARWLFDLIRRKTKPLLIGLMPFALLGCADVPESDGDKQLPILPDLFFMNEAPPQVGQNMRSSTNRWELSSVYRAVSMATYNGEHIETIIGEDGNAYLSAESVIQATGITQAWVLEHGGTYFSAGHGTDNSLKYFPDIHACRGFFSLKKIYEHATQEQNETGQPTATINAVEHCDYSNIVQKGWNILASDDIDEPTTVHEYLSKHDWLVKNTRSFWWFRDGVWYYYTRNTESLEYLRSKAGTHGFVELGDQDMISPNNAFFVYTEEQPNAFPTEITEAQFGDGVFTFFLSDKDRLFDENPDLLTNYISSITIVKTDGSTELVNIEDVVRNNIVDLSAINDLIRELLGSAGITAIDDALLSADLSAPIKLELSIPNNSRFPRAHARGAYRFKHCF